MSSLFRKNLWVLLLATPFLFAAKNASAEYKIRWLLAHDPVKAFDNAAMHFKKKVEKDTNGEVKVEVMTVREFNKGMPMSESQVYEALKAGDFEMCQTYGTFLGSKKPQFWAFDLPYLFRDYKHAEKVITGEIGREILASLDSEKLHGMAITYSGGFRVIPAVSKKLTKLEDFQGMHLRIPRYSSVASVMYERFGAVPVPMNPEAASLAQSASLVEGMETTIPRFWELENREVSKVVNDTGHSLYVTALVINDDFYQKLPAKHRKAVQKAAEEAASIERKDAIKLGKDLKKEMKSKGYTVVEMPKAEKARLRKASASVYADFENVIGRDLVARIRATK